MWWNKIYLCTLYLYLDEIFNSYEPIISNTYKTYPFNLTPVGAIKLKPHPPSESEFLARILRQPVSGQSSIPAVCQLDPSEVTQGTLFFFEALGSLLEVLDTWLSWLLEVLSLIWEEEVVEVFGGAFPFFWLLLDIRCTSSTKG